MRTALYRHFDAAGALLYVGISLSAVQRLSQHSTKAHWYGQIVRVDIEWLPSRERALASEAIAIARENPKHNRMRPFVEAAPTIAALPSINYSIEHVASGRRDGNYFDEFGAREMLAFWRDSYPHDRFELLSYGTGGRPVLRAFDAHLWSAAK